MKEENVKKNEEAILNFWKKNKIFEKTLKTRNKKRPFVFYEGPPTANGLPGIHHILARSFKDLICRYKTMCGFYVERKAGWDTHGLPVEIEVEKELGFKNKTQIEEYGINKFNAKAKESVWRYKKEWEKSTEEIGYFIDLKNPYVTFEPQYIETVFWLIKQIAKRGLLYKDYKVLPYCPRCSTPLSSHEVSQGYKTVQDPSVYVKFLVLNPFKLGLNLNFKSNLFFLVWTTTPWTLPANTAIAINSKLKYKILLDEEKEQYFISYNAVDNNLKLVGEIEGKKLIGLKYQPLYSYSLKEEDKKVYEVVEGDFISLEEGTGLVHIAPAFGEEDMKLSRQKNLLMIKNIDDKGYLTEPPNELLEIKGKFFKEVDPLIFNDLSKRDLLYKGELKGILHEYPFCWRCHTPLIYYAFEAWYIKVSKIKKDLIKNNQKINWIPAHIKKGRFGQWLKEAKDWTLSRNRYWGTPLPVWECEKCGYFKVVGSIKELGQRPLNEKGEVDLHRDYIDKITFKCPKCGGLMKRRKEVIDCWFDSGSMPYAQFHFPFNLIKDKKVDPSKVNYKKLISKIPFPADFICEGVDQTRGWFYTLLVISTLLGLGPSYKNAISLGLVLDKKGEKMSKSKGNMVDPEKVLEKYGADALRWYFFSVNPPGEEKRFNEEDIGIYQRRSLLTLKNSFVFYSNYAYKKNAKTGNLTLLNLWILSRLEETKKKVIDYLDKYLVFEATKEIDNFIDDLSRWYIRRKRKVFQKQEPEKDWVQSSIVLRKVLKELVLIMAPFCPFLTEEIWQKIKDKKDKESVHLASYPNYDSKTFNKKIISLMEEVRYFTNLGLSLRKKTQIKVRQPLKSLTIKNTSSKIKKYPELLALLQDEINVKEIIFNSHLKEEAELDTTLTPDLIEEGIIRELIRQIQEQRKNLGLTPKKKISLNLIIKDKELKETILKNKIKIQEETSIKEIIIVGKEEVEKEYQKIEVGENKEIWLKIILK
ncbi:MAG TPA: isoleucine--tRNA ligase [Candidatus Paceibacterota bacterium]|mgnify:FL=1|nr:isoleucine--tRNA ligase [Candidatus Paceibacterota bacterium]